MKNDDRDGFLRKQLVDEDILERRIFSFTTWVVFSRNYRDPQVCTTFFIWLSLISMHFVFLSLSLITRLILMFSRSFSINLIHVTKQ